MHDVAFAPPSLLAGALAAIGAPALGFLALAIAVVVGRTPGERTIAWGTRWATVTSLVGACSLAWAVLRGAPPTEVPLGTWFSLGDVHVDLVLLVDRAAVTMSMLTAVLGGLVGHFSVSYLHRDRGYARFFLLLLLFVGAMQVVSLAGSGDVLFLGWEALGITSTLLIAHFGERRDPGRNALRAFITYRTCDVGLLLALVLWHHEAGTTRFLDLPAHASGLSVLVPLGLLIGAMGKAAQLPFSGWLPRAMEGPTPSSALFYGALSVHAGAFLLLRASPALAAHPTVAVAAAAVGLSTALVATLVGRVQPDVKGALAHAAMTQVGLVFVEIALGLHGFALIHVVGHAILRARQLLQAPGVLEHDRALVAAAGGVRGRTGAHLERLLPAALQRRLYGLALDRFGLDAAVDRLVVRPVLALARALDDLDRTWSGDLHGVDPRDRRAEVSSPDLTPLPAPPSRGGEG